MHAENGSHWNFYSGQAMTASKDSLTVNEHIKYIHSLEKWKLDLNGFKSIWFPLHV